MKKLLTESATGSVTCVVTWGPKGCRQIYPVLNPRRSSNFWSFDFAINLILMLWALRFVSRWLWFAMFLGLLFTPHFSWVSGDEHRMFRSNLVPPTRYYPIALWCDRSLKITVYHDEFLKFVKFQFFSTIVKKSPAQYL